LKLKRIILTNEVLFKIIIHHIWVGSHDLTGSSLVPPMIQTSTEVEKIHSDWIYFYPCTQVTWEFFLSSQALNLSFILFFLVYYVCKDEIINTNIVDFWAKENCIKIQYIPNFRIYFIFFLLKCLYVIFFS
jgi:hypothetical protein